MLADSVLKAMAADHLLGFYLCDLDRFEANYAEFLGAFQRHYPNTRIAYSYKTNYLPTLCRRIDELGGYAEVVSGMEYRLARKFGVSGVDIVFNGPVKTMDQLLEAARSGSTVNIESDYELALLKEAAGRFPNIEHRVGLRCAVHFQGSTPSRFGFNIDAPEFQERAERLLQLPGVRFEGLHCHMIPPGRTAENYARIAGHLVGLGQEIWGTDGPRYIDMGGGYFSNMSPELRRQFDVDIPSFEEYGEAITGPFLEAWGADGGPELILEPGLALVADAFSFVCRVLDTKTTGDKRLALVGGSVYNIRPTKSLRNLPARCIPAGDDGARIEPPLNVVGYTCMEDDILHRGYDRALGAGDVMIFDNVGAYTLVLKPPFIQGNVPVYAVRQGQTVTPLLKRAETAEDFLQSFDH